TPCVRVAGGPGGIAQEGLRLIKGKEYVGRVILAGDAAAGPVDVRLVWGEGESARAVVTVDALTGAFAKRPLRFTAGASTDAGRLEIVARGTGAFRVGTVSLMPADNVHGMRADTLALLRELDAPIYRWPGGNFVSGYDWKDGIGDPDKRPPRKNPAWKGVEHNDFGLDEFMVYCRELGTEPLIVVNSGLGGVRLALDELEYANGGVDTEMGRWRAENGHPEPYKVVWWGIGNEMYGKWQLGHMPLEDYVKKHNQFADAMRGADPSIKLVAVGATGPWSEMMLAECADHMDALSEHFYCREADAGLMAHVRQIPDNVRHKAVEHRKYHETIDSLEGKLIPIALDEWNYWYGPELYGQIGTRYFLRDALGIAAGIHEMARNSDVFLMANYAQTVNVIGAIKTSKTAAAFDTTGLVLKLYRHQFGVTPVAVTGDFRPLDVAAAWTADRAALTVGIVNPTRAAYTMPIEVRGAGLTGAGRLWRIAGDDPMAYNEPGRPDTVVIAEEAVSGPGGTVEVAPLSVSLYRLEVK
ncbi:MAG: alpha-L-arabinofuranosidase, partial [Candidatus Hydrogenedentes bacterium]|nr:alpha-L-arabinofuranosidase [Candidatus Hydrogenedentota bacterium]